MNGRARLTERGFTLIETLVAAGIVVATMAAGIGLSLSSRSLVVATAAAEFDHLLDSTRAIAHETNGATIVFAPDAYGDGTEARVLTGGAGAALVPTAMPVVHARAAISEAVLGAAPFAFVVHATGRLAGLPGFRLGGAPPGAETPCPPSGSFHFTITAAGTSADRYVPCRIDLASNGTVTLPTWPAASPAASPTACASCTTATLPPMPSATSCPPGFTSSASGCVAANAPRYHVTASAASAAFSVGGTDAVSVQATLANPLAVAPGTPPSAPVLLASSDPSCTPSPSTSQPSGSSFSVSGVNAGTCTLTASADISTIAGASADTATLVLTVGASPVPSPTPVATPTPSSCDLVANGKCYHLIVPQTNLLFTKYVFPGSTCPQGQSEVCSYVDTVASVVLPQPFTIQLLAPATDASHELLVSIDKLTSVDVGCEPFSDFAAIPANQPIPWPQVVNGSPVASPTGFGEPSRYITVNTISADPNQLLAQFPWQQGTTAAEIATSINRQLVGTAFQFTFSGSAATQLFWSPDFAGCDSLAVLVSPAMQYGLVAVALTFKIYQASP